jgi:hypothetical protein
MTAKSPSERRPLSANVSAVGWVVTQRLLFRSQRWVFNPAYGYQAATVTNATP